jgi:hypothetical protein
MISSTKGVSHQNQRDESPIHPNPTSSAIIQFLSKNNFFIKNKRKQKIKLIWITFAHPAHPEQKKNTKMIQPINVEQPDLNLNSHRVSYIRAFNIIWWTMPCKTAHESEP